MKTHKIYFENRCIVICPPDDPLLSDPNAIEFRPGKEVNIHNLVGMFENSKDLSKIYVPSEDIDLVYKQICNEFINVDAAGGLVSNKRGDYLLIRRFGLWDLPKGHREEGEEIGVTAIREVTEETGIDNLELGNLICITDHCYLRDGKWFLKHTWWFEMSYMNATDTTPQREEDISKAAWVAKSSLPPFLQNTFPSIVEVFREARV